MEKTTRISLEMSPMQCAVAMIEGNPGAMRAVVEVMNFKGDPDNMLGGFAPLLTLDSYEIYGFKIYVLFNDICLGDVAKSCAVIRAVQLGEFSGDVLFDACSREDRSGRDLVPVDELYKRVKHILPNFDREFSEN